jgi:YfiH family protein
MDEQSGEVDGADRCGRTDSSDVDSATDADSSSGVDESPACDAAIITQPGTAVAFTTADCLPLVCVSTEEKVAAAIHAGWRGLAAGVIERTVERMTDAGAVRTEGLRVWIGPAIAREDYEVNHDVKDALLARPAITAEHFTPCGTGHFLADLPGAATAIFASLGVPSSAVERCPLSTKSNVFLHSFRRDGAAAGRIATVVGIRRWGEGS